MYFDWILDCINDYKLKGGWHHGLFIFHPTNPHDDICMPTSTHGRVNTKGCIEI